MSRLTNDKLRFPEPAGEGTGDLKLVVDHLQMVGTSISALATAFAVDTLNTAIDMGRCSALLAAQDTVLLTHCHSDHVAGLVAWLSAHTRRHEGSPTRIVVHHERRDQLLRALQHWPDLDGVRRRVDLDDVLMEAHAGDRVDLGNGGWARSFDVHHSTPSLGWWVGGSDNHRPRFTFAGDGTVIPFTEDPGLLDSTVAVVDCSFVDDGTRVAARLGGHGHLQDWLDLLPQLTCDLLVLAHLPVEVNAQMIAERIGTIDQGPMIVPWISPGTDGA